MQVCKLGLQCPGLWQFRAISISLANFISGMVIVGYCRVAKDLSSVWL